MNIKNKSFWFWTTWCLFIILVGVGLNGFVMKSNNGLMPLDVTGNLEKGGYVIISEETNYSFLADIIQINTPKKHILISVGDVIMFLGLILFTIISVKFLYKINTRKKYNNRDPSEVWAEYMRGFKKELAKAYKEE